MDQIELGKFINELRIEANLTQDELAKKIGVSSGKIISKWENGYSIPDFLILKKLSIALNVTLYELSICKRLKKKNLILKTKNFIKSSKDIFKLNLIGRVLIITAIIFGIIFGICTAYTISNYNTVKIFEFKSLDENFTIKGNVVISKEYNVLNLLNIYYIGKENKKNTDNILNIEYTLSNSNDKNIIIYSCHETKNNYKKKLLDYINTKGFSYTIDNSLKKQIEFNEDDILFINILYENENKELKNINIPFKLIKKYQNNFNIF